MPVIVIDGANGTGTSTQCQLLCDKLEDEGKNYVLTSHPGSTELGTELRKLLKFSALSTTPQQDLLLFAADAMAFYQEYIVYMKDEYIVCDRLNLVGFWAYQRTAGAQPSEIMAIYDALSEFGWKYKFDHLFVIDAKYEVLRDRIENPNLVKLDQQEGAKKDRFESRGNDFMERVCSQYHEIDGKHPVMRYFDNFHKIDGTQSVKAIHEQIYRLQAQI